MKEEEIRKREVFNKYLDLVRIDAEHFFADQTKFITISCPACGSASNKKEIMKNGFTYVQCSDCATLYVNPRPPFNELMNFYADSPSTSYWVSDFFLPVVEVRREKIFKPRAAYIAERFPHFSKNRIGDIGSGFGIFLEEMKKLWIAAELIAIEPSQEMAQICRSKGLAVLESPLEMIDENANQFDLLTAFELFEHLHDPKPFLEKVYRLLSPGGYFYLTTLNGLGFDIQIFWEKSKSVSPPHHLNFFNPQSLCILMESVGFKIIEASTPGQLDWDIVEGQWNNEDADPGRFWKTLSKYGSDASKAKLQEWIRENNFSSHMRIVVQK